MHFKAAITGNVTAQNMLNQLGAAATRGLAGILTDVLIDLTGATAADVTITDATGNVFVITGVAADALYKIDNAAIKRNNIEGPFTVTTANVSGGDTTLTVHMWVNPLFQR